MYMRIPRRLRYPDDEDFVVFDKPRRTRRRRRQATAPDVTDLIAYTEETLEALKKFEDKQKEKYTPKPGATKPQKIPYATGLIICFFLAPLVWITVGTLFYKLGKMLILGE